MFAIQAQKLTKRYGGSRGVTDLDLEVHRGEMFGFIGPNGAGKSTTIRMILQLIAPTAGSLSVLGTTITGDHPILRQRIGYLPSEIRLYPDLTGRQALEFAAGVHSVELSKSPVMEYAQRLQLDLKMKVKSYSLGNRKKLGILLSVIHEPELLILDEPTSGLDPLMQQEFFNLLRHLNESKGTTVFFSTHVLTEVEKLCDRVAIIRDGKLIRVSSVAEITSSGGHLVEVKFAQAGDLRDAYSIYRLDAGAEYSNEVHTIRIGDNLNEALKWLADRDIHDLNIRRPTLEERFMDEYRKPVTSEGGNQLVTNSSL
jgi:ABC-2 type transport system ATP-binding protein